MSVVWDLWCHVLQKTEFSLGLIKLRIVSLNFQEWHFDTQKTLSIWRKIHHATMLIENKTAFFYLFLPTLFMCVLLLLRNKNYMLLILIILIILILTVLVLVLSLYFASHFSKIKWFNILSISTQTEIKYIRQIKQE